MSPQDAPISRNKLIQGNAAYRNKDFSEAIRCYVELLISKPASGKLATTNLALAQRRYRKERKQDTQLKAAVCGWELSHNAANRVYTLAGLYQAFAHIDIIGCHFPAWGREIWAPVPDKEISIHSFVVEDETRFIEQALQIVANHPYDLVHLSSPRLPNILFGILYKKIWGAQVLVDIDSGGKIPTIGLNEYTKQQGKLPGLNDLVGEDWTRLSFALAKSFDGVTESGEISSGHVDELRQLCEQTGNSSLGQDVQELGKAIGGQVLDVVLDIPNPKANPAQQQIAKLEQTSQTQLECPANLEPYYFERIQQSGLFDVQWYLQKYAGRYKIDTNPLAHYLKFSLHEGLNPSPAFDTTYYWGANPDLKKSDLHPFVHYVVHGCKEGRRPLPPEYQTKYPVSGPEYIPRLSTDAPPVTQAVRVIAFYLPQFHAIPENDAWWGKGFTEWTNVKPAKPQFNGHYQPHVPDDFLGYYNLLDGTTQAKQVELARQYGVEGFCFYLYWFNGRRLLEQPVDNYLHDASLDLPFCICWANENWSRRWDGGDNDLLMEQHHSAEDDISFIIHAANYLRDPRYIRVNGKPLLLVYRPNLFPNMRETARRWRKWCRDNGIGEIYLTYPQSFESVDPAEYGFDAACEFPPNRSKAPNITYQVEPRVNDFQLNVYDWRIFIERSENYEDPGYTLFRSVSPSWDNTARRKNKGTVYHNSCPKLFEKWLTNAFNDTLQRHSKPDEQIVFINAWNEWAEGAHLEPDQRYGYAWLGAIRNAQKNAYPLKHKVAMHIHAYYDDVFEDILNRLSQIRIKHLTLFVTVPKEKTEQVNKLLQASDFNYFVATCNNRGRDILPFIKIAKVILAQGYEYIIKIHTKKSLHRDDGDQWREGIYSEMLSDDFIISAIHTMETSKDVGIVSPNGQIVPMNDYWGTNFKLVNTLAQKTGVDSTIFTDLNFVAGNMFAIRKDVVQGLIKLDLQEGEFEVEKGQIDGTLAHAIERFFSVLCYHKNLKIINLETTFVNKDFKYAKKIVLEDIKQ